MTDLPNRAHLASSYPVPTWSQHLAALGGLYDVVAQLCGTQQSEALIITAGRVSPARGSITVDSEGGAAADDLTHIVPAALPLGRWLYIRCVTAAHVITVKHQAGGEGQITLVAGREMILNALDKWLLLERSGSGWSEIARGYGADTPAARSALGLATVAVSGSYSDLTNKPDLTEYLSRGQIGIAAQEAPGQGGPNGAIVSINGTALSGFGEVTGYATYAGFDVQPLVWGWSYVIGTGNSPHAGYQGGYRQRVSMGYEHGDYALEWCVPRYGTGPDADPTAVYTRQMTANAWGGWSKISAGNADTLGGYNASQITGAVKKYLVLDQYNGNIIQNSLGISSITDHAVGQYTVSFTTPWPYTYYLPATCTLGDTGDPDCVVIEDTPPLTLWTTSQIRMAHKRSGPTSYTDGRPDTLLFAGM